MNTKRYDLITIGGGSGGLAAARRAAELGHKVAVIEPDALGGTCVNRGCVPKKIMWYAAGIAHAADDAGAFGVAVTRGETDWRLLATKRDAYVSRISRYWENDVRERGIDRIAGRARLVATGTVEVSGLRLFADHIVIATGGSPIVPSLPGAELGITSDGFFDLEAQPRRVAVVGGGYIAVELGGMLRGLGSHVSLFALEQRILERFDPMVSETLAAEMVKQGIVVNAGFTVTAVQRAPGGYAVVSADERVVGGFDTVIWAVGRSPASEDLGLEEVGVHTVAGGYISVDRYQNTSVPGIYAIGDVTGRSPLTPVAVAAGRKLAERLFGGRSSSALDYDNIPSVVFSHPPVGTIGLTEPEARERCDGRVTVYETRFKPMRQALSDHPCVTAMKLVCAGDDERVVGLHVVGEGADEMLQGFAVALKMGATKSDLDGTIAIHPTSAEELVTMKTARPPLNTEEEMSDAVRWRKAS